MQLQCHPLVSGIVTAGVSALPFSRPAQRSGNLRPVWSLNRLTRRTSCSQWQSFPRNAYSRGNRCGNPHRSTPEVRLGNERNVCSAPEDAGIHMSRCRDCAMRFRVGIAHLAACGHGAPLAPNPPCVRPKLRTTLTPDASRSHQLQRIAGPPLPPLHQSVPRLRAWVYRLLRAAEPRAPRILARPRFRDPLVFKPDAASLLRAELGKPGCRCAPIALGTNTEPYCSRHTPQSSPESWASSTGRSPPASSAAPDCAYAPAPVPEPSPSSNASAVARHPPAHALRRRRLHLRR